MSSVRRLVCALALLVAVAFAVPMAQGRPIAYTYASIDYPSAPITFAFGLNEKGQIVGNYFDSSFDRHAFLLSDSSFSTIDPPAGTSDT